MGGSNKAESVVVYCNQQARKVIGIRFWLLGCFLISLATSFTCYLAYRRTNHRKSNHSAGSLSGLKLEINQSSTLRQWNSCVAWPETFPGMHDDWCTGDIGEDGWFHVNQSKSECKEGYGKGVCERMPVPHKPMEYYDAVPSRLIRKKQSESVNIGAINRVLKGRLYLLEEYFKFMHGSVTMLESFPTNVTTLLDRCLSFKNLNFYEYQHSPELWIPYHLLHHEKTSLLLNKNATNHDLKLVYYALYPHAHAICQRSPHYERLDYATNHVVSSLTTLLDAPFWNEGFNIIVPASHPCVPLSSLSMIMNTSRVAHPTFLTVDYDVNAKYPKDIIIPYFADVRRRELARNATRSILLMLCSGPAQYTRSRILSIYSNISNDVIVKHGHVSSEMYETLLETTKFCLMVRGDTVSSARFFSLIDAGCIPVIVSDWTYLPYQRLINYAHFTIFIRESLVVNTPAKFLARLRGITSKKIEQMQIFLRQARLLLLYDSSYFLNPVTLMFIESGLLRQCYNCDTAHPICRKFPEFTV